MRRLAEFLNVKLNQKIIEEMFDDYFIFPDPVIPGISSGAALSVSAEHYGKYTNTRIKDVYWGPSFTDDEIEKLLIERALNYKKSKNISQDVAAELANGKIVAWFQGRMECGPRALRKVNFVRCELCQK